MISKPRQHSFALRVNGTGRVRVPWFGKALLSVGIAGMSMLASSSVPVAKLGAGVTALSLGGGQNGPGDQAPPLLPPLSAGSPVGYLPGGGSVTASGAFTYELPIAVPAGRAGVEPSLSVSYTSGSGNGLLGLGFGLSGASSAIVRCGKDLLSADHRTGVTFTAADEFCLDGQRLVAVSGTYGAAGDAISNLVGRDGPHRVDERGRFGTGAICGAGQGRADTDVRSADARYGAAD